MVVGPGGPANTLCSRRVLGRVIRITHDRRLVVFSSRVCSELIVSSLGRVSVTSLTPSVPYVAFGKLSGSREVTKFHYN